MLWLSGMCRVSWFLYAWCVVWLGLTLTLCKHVCADGCRIPDCQVNCRVVAHDGSPSDEFGLHFSEPFLRSSWRPIGTDYLNHAPRSTGATRHVYSNLDPKMIGYVRAETPNSVHQAVLGLQDASKFWADLCVYSSYSTHRAVLCLTDEFESLVNQRLLQALSVLGMNLTVNGTSSQTRCGPLFHTTERQSLISCSTQLGVQVLLQPNVSSLMERTKSVKAVTKTGSLKAVLEDVNKLLSKGLELSSSKASTLMNQCFYCFKASQLAVIAPSLDAPELTVTWKTLRAHGHPSSFNKEPDCRIVMSLCPYPSHPNGNFMSMNLIETAEGSIGLSSKCRNRIYCGGDFRTSSAKLMKVPFLEPPISSKLVLKISLIAFISMVALCIRAVMQERLPQIVERRSWQVCNYTIYLQSSPSTICMKTCSMSNWCEHSFYDGCAGSKDRTTHSRHGPLKCKICLLILKFASYIFHVFLLLVNFRLEVTQHVSDVKVNEYYKAMKKAGTKLPSNSKAQPKKQFSENGRLKGFCKTSRVNVTNPDTSLHKQSREECSLPLAMPPLFIPPKVDIVNETCSSELESLFLKDLQLRDDHEVFPLKEESRRRRKRRGKLNTLKHGGDKNCPSGSSSPSSPASHATPLSSCHSRSNFMACTSFDGIPRWANSPKRVDSSSRTLSQLDVACHTPRSRTSMVPGAHVDNALIEAQTLVNPHVFLNECDTIIQEDKGIAVENWASVARSAIVACEMTCPFQCQLSVSEPERTTGGISRKGTLVSSTTFPQAECQNSSQEKVPYNGPLFSSPSLMESSLARAPGSSSLLKQHEYQNIEQVNASKESEPVYDIWGDHFMEISRMRLCPSNSYYDQPSTQQNNLNVASNQTCLYPRESFFVKPYFMISDAFST